MVFEYGVKNTQAAAYKGTRMVYDKVSVAICSNKNDGVKMAKRWCRGSKNSKISKTLFRAKNLSLMNSKFIL